MRIEEKPAAAERKTGPELPRAAGRLFIEKLRLTQFRSFASADFAFENGLVLLAGPNGAGKTHVLEAISLLAPGKGLRAAKPADITRKGGNAVSEWAVAATLSSALSSIRIGTGLGADAAGRQRRRFRLEGETASAEAIAARVRIVSLTPAMDRLLDGAKEARRAFFDAIVASVDPAHLPRLARYDRARSERLRLLKDGGAAPSWLASLEHLMAEEGVAIAVARRGALALLKDAIASGAPWRDEALFPCAALALEGEVETALETKSASDAALWLEAGLAAGRERDGAAGITFLGPHRSDLRVRHAAKDMPAETCSTGEQKALIVNLVLAHVHLVRERFGAGPIVLLDAIASFLDAERRSALFLALEREGLQVFMTGTDLSAFVAISGRAQVVALGEGGKDGQGWERAR